MLSRQNLSSLRNAFEHSRVKYVLTCAFLVYLSWKNDRTLVLIKLKEVRCSFTSTVHRHCRAKKQPPHASIIIEKDSV